MRKLNSYAKNVIVHDVLLDGSPPLGYAATILSINLSPSPIEYIFNLVLQKALLIGGIQNLYVMCHGYSGSNIATQQSADTGGFGLQLGSNGFFISDAPKSSVLKGKVKRIIIYACAAADDSSKSVDPKFDGKRFMGELAYYTGAYVVASDKIQWYNRVTIAHPFSYIGGMGDENMMDFGKWEGNVYEFPPNADQPKILKL